MIHPRFVSGTIIDYLHSVSIPYVMGRCCVLVILSIFLSLTLKGQIEGFPNISLKDFARTVSPVIDSNNHAVVLWEQGRSEIQVYDSEPRIRLIHRYAVRIKILKKEGFEKANYTIPLYKIRDHFEYAENIRGYTHNYDGQIWTMTMDKNAIFHEKVNEYVNLTKFTLPNISEGSIIDIFYDIVSTDIFNFRGWRYQDDIPKLYSEYTAIIPAMFEYNVSLKGGYELSDLKSSRLDAYFLISGSRYDCSKMVYTMKDIPAFKEESYMLAPVNYISAINFELIQYHLPRGGKQVFSKEWEDVTQELLKDNSFGKQMDRTRDFRSVLKEITVPSDSDLIKAKKIYEYIKNQIRWNQNYGKYSQFGVQKALAQRHGNVGDINLGLIAALRGAGLEAYPIVISTRQNGLPNTLHPVLSDFDYVIVQIRVNGQNYFLDATERNLPFGLLPLRCINGSGRIIYSRRSSEWIKLENEIESQVNYTISGKIDTNGLLSGSLTISHKGLAALNIRNRIRSFNSIDAYIEDQMDRVTPIRIQDGEVRNIDSLDNPLEEFFQITLDLSNQLEGGKLTFNPIFINRITKNPFNLEERNYHVDLGSRILETLSVSIFLPEGYTLQSQPENIRFALPENGTDFTYQSLYDGNVLQMRQTMGLNKAIYEVDEYFHLKEFFSMIIQHQRIDFIFQKQ